MMFDRNCPISIYDCRLRAVTTGCGNSLHALAFNHWEGEISERESVQATAKDRNPPADGPLHLGVNEISLWQVSYYMRWSDRLIPNFSILCRSVFGCIPRVLAAPFAPSITPRVSCSTAQM